MKIFLRGDLSEVMVCLSNFFWPKNHLFQKLLSFSYGGSTKIILRGDLSEVRCVYRTFSGKKITFFKNYYHFRMEEE